MGEEKQQPPSHWHIITPIKRQIAVAMTIAVFSVLCSLLSICALAWLVRASLPAEAVQWRWFMSALGFAVAAYLLRGLAFKRSHLAAFALEPILRGRLVRHLATLPLGTIQQQGAAAMAKVILDDVRDLHVFVADSTPLYARAYAAPLLTMLILLWLDLRLALLACAVLAVGMLILGLVMKNSTDISQRYNAAREQVNQAVIEFVQAMPVVRTFDSGKASFGRYEAALDSYLSILLRWYRQSGVASRLSLQILNPMPTLLALLWAGLFWLWHDSLDFSVWLACLLLGTGMAEAMMPYMALYHQIDKAKISIARIHEVMSLPPLPLSPQPQSPRDASVAFVNVDFSYPGRSRPALSAVSFQVESGSFTALVGASGAGKSTVARLIPRFWDVSAGRVEVGGVDVRDIDPQVLMQHVAFVFQDNFLFSASIADNIRLGSPDTPLDAVIAAAKAAQAHAFISALPQGYDTPVGERGANLSGGQRQRITIARAILQNRPILVLDEATAFADAENEALLMQALANLMRGKTVLMIAHRLAGIQHADQILVFADGKLVEAGAPAKLLAQNGAYSALWQAYQQAQQWHIQA